MNYHANPDRGESFTMGVTRALLFGADREPSLEGVRAVAAKHIPSDPRDEMEAALHRLTQDPYDRLNPVAQHLVDVYRREGFPSWPSYDGDAPGLPDDGRHRWSIFGA